MKDGSYVNSTVTSITMLDAWVATLVCCVVERVKHGEDRKNTATR